eukprot:CAMPEP_0198366018 /NCGR_PEP_ID=MMETSP1450-20131203/154470_1 /TAXON_ID=753684 ORGANISM="Madagascaria erythrocladiodes, Strain CCMP3234" /NCGR_SAMPLE_ID=MMETSP1450 /ASSEMBLY_ACC=CAM_ASM_001115 /LENGTH=162 /DNA_ID=CAMNT_0044073481 /DNA_START=1357 /DNA_END=1842 /DNA_ORIENTATION=-
MRMVVGLEARLLRVVGQVFAYVAAGERMRPPLITHLCRCCEAQGRQQSWSSCQAVLTACLTQSCQQHRKRKSKRTFSRPSLSPARQETCSPRPRLQNGLGRPVAIDGCCTTMYGAQRLCCLHRKVPLVQSLGHSRGLKVIIQALLAAHPRLSADKSRAVRVG